MSFGPGIGCLRSAARSSGVGRGLGPMWFICGLWWCGVEEGLGHGHGGRYYLHGLSSYSGLVYFT